MFSQSTEKFDAAISISTQNLHKAVSHVVFK